MIHADLLGERARLSPGKTALVFVPTGERLTYAAWNARAERTARLLVGALGLQPGDRFGVLAPNRVEVLDLFFAAAKSGTVFVPLGTRLTPHELTAIAADAGLSVLLHAASLGGTASAIGGVPRLLDLDGPLPGAADLPLPGPPADAEAPVALLYTSGTTGTPKGVVVPHRMVAWNAIATVLGWGLREDDVTPVFTPLYHAGGLFAFLTPVVAAGGTIVLHDSFDAGEVLAAIARERATVVLGVPTIFRMLAGDPGFASADLSSVRFFISGGAPLPRSLWETWHARGVVLKQGYGLTEVGVNCFAMSAEESVAKAGTIGRPLPFTEAKVVDDAGGAVPDGAVGELCFRGPHVSSGYWRNPGATAASRDAEGWFHTGDMATRDADGFFTIAGRRKEMFISGGVNVYPAEVEQAILQHPDVVDAAVVAVPHETWGEVGIAFVVARPGASLETLGAFLEARLARFKLPREVVRLDALPRTPYGKVVKGELRERFLGERA